MLEKRVTFHTYPGIHLWFIRGSLALKDFIFLERTYRHKSSIVHQERVFFRYALVNILARALSQNVECGSERLYNILDRVLHLHLRRSVVEGVYFP